mmetsp:Transcript_13321/g.35732  ORF Transcript_13321/g.35732 Transcript_13321/m.35732 type:complete len:288 (-) Transcript_13321:573-1436(-)
MEAAGPIGVSFFRAASRQARAVLATASVSRWSGTPTTLRRRARLTSPGATAGLASGRPWMPRSPTFAWRSSEGPGRPATWGSTCPRAPRAPREPAPRRFGWSLVLPSALLRRGHLEMGTRQAKRWQAGTCTKETGRGCTNRPPARISTFLRRRSGDWMHRLGLPYDWRRSSSARCPPSTTCRIAIGSVLVSLPGSALRGAGAPQCRPRDRRSTMKNGAGLWLTHSLAVTLSRTRSPMPCVPLRASTQATPSLPATLSSACSASARSSIANGRPSSARQWGFWRRRLV